MRQHGLKVHLRNGQVEMARVKIFLAVLLWGVFFSTAQPKGGVNIIIETNTPGASVTLDDRPVQAIPSNGNLLLRSVPAGKHILKIAKDGYIALTTTIVVGELSNHFKFNLARASRVTAPPSKENGGIEPSGSGLKGDAALFLFLILFIATVLLGLARFIQATRNMGIMGRFKLRRIIGKGGIATIYNAKDLERGNVVALKIMDRDLTRDKELVGKFLREGEAIEAINRKFPEAPVVKVLEHGRDPEKSLGIPYIAMELLKGAHLLSIIKRNGNMPLQRKLYIAGQVARALKASHRLNIFHGDVTPDNVFVNGERVTLFDFGIACGEHDNVKNMDAAITGKPVYMSPEQCAGDSIDGKSDVYSLGVVLYLMCNGAPPFIASNPTEIMRMHREDPVPPLSSPLPGEVKLFIYQTLEKEPDLRPDAGEAAERLETFMERAGDSQRS